MYSYTSSFHTVWVQQKSVRLHFFVSYSFLVFRLSLFKSSLWLLIEKTEHSKSFANCVWAVLGLLWVVSTIFGTFFFQKLHYDFESMVYVLGFLEWIHSDRTSHLTKVRKNFFQSSLCLLLESRQIIWHVLQVFFFKSQIFLTTGEQFFSKQNRKVLALNPIVNKNEEWMCIKHSFSHWNYMPPTTLRTFIQEKLVYWFWKKILTEPFPEFRQGRHFIILFRRYSAIAVCFFSKILTCCFQPSLILLSFFQAFFLWMVL